MARPNFFDQFDDPELDQRQQRNVRKDEASIASSETGAAANVAGLPYIKPKAEADLEAKGRDRQLAPLQISLQEKKDFDSLKPVRVYTDSLPYLDASLRTQAGPAGDSELIMLAAKIQDPMGSVREGDELRYNNIQTALERIPQKFANEFMREGKFNERTREDVRNFLIGRVKSYRTGYDLERKRATARIANSNKRGDMQLDPLDVVGPHAGSAFFDRFVEYDKLRQKGEAQPTRADVLQGGVPEGAHVKGEDVPGYRFNPAQEQALKAYFGSPKFTPEGLAGMMGQFATQQGATVDEAFRTSALAEANRVAGLRNPQQPQLGGVDYSQIDKAATENAGLGQAISQTLENMPESAYNLGAAMLAPATDLGKSIDAGQREGLYKTIPDLFTDPATREAAGQAMSERFGGADELKRTAITDPLGLAGDASLAAQLTGKGLARLPGQMASDVGERIATAGRAIDPISAVVGAGEAVAPLVKPAASAVGTGLAGVVGFPSGVGGATVREGFKAGQSRGAAGAPTPQSRAFTESMREPGAATENLVTAARDALGQLRTMASQKYQAAMAQFGQNPQPLDIGNVIQRVQTIKPRNYDALVDAPKRPSEHLAWEQMMGTVEHYAAKAQQDPNLLLPLQMDQFKQDLYDIGSKVGGAFDRDAARIAGTAYGAVREELVKHDPIYAEIMADYEKAAKETQQLEHSFSLRAARGKEPNIDAAARSLQATMRNNAYTNYGQREAQAGRLAELDPSKTLMPMLGGQTASATMPRGMRASIGAAGTGTGMMFGVPLAPAGLVALPLTSPRATGEVAYGAGRLAGTAERVGASAPMQSLMGASRSLKDFYDKYPGAALASSRVSAGQRSVEDEQRDELARRYGLTPPGSF